MRRGGEGVTVPMREDRPHPAPDFTALAVEAVARRQSFVRYFKDGPVPKLRIVEGRAASGSPRVSVIIPTADGARGGYLDALLRQLDAQTLQSFEVIIVIGDRRQGRAINTAAAIARGDLIVTMDDDTRIGPDDLLERIAAAFDADPTLGIAGVANVVPSDASWILRRAMRELPRRSSAVATRIVDSDMAEHPCLAIRRETFYAIGGEHEIIPRGLDPYLRREVRGRGLRVVVLPHLWIHHLLPPTLRGILRQYHRNGVGSAFVKKFHPEFVIDQALDHGRDIPSDHGLFPRALRYGARLGGALLTGRWIYLATLFTYAVGYTWGLRNLREDSL
jgi:glycosyltransferase involved in cell wall biosynthesis